MLYQVTISRAGTVIDTVQIEAEDALCAIEQLDADREKFIVLISHGHEELLTEHWSGFEYEARKIPFR
ncbi:MAG: hypothetical protein Kow0031_33220 [Anaerolineae bacterium]